MEGFGKAEIGVEWLKRRNWALGGETPLGPFVESDEDRTLRDSERPEPGLGRPVDLDAVDLDVLIEVRHSDEARAFRAWLWNAGSADEDDIAEALADLSSTLRERLGKALSSDGGKTLRVAMASLASKAIASTIAGPPGFVASMAPGLANAHLLGRI